MGISKNKRLAESIGPVRLKDLDNTRDIWTRDILKEIRKESLKAKENITSGSFTRY